MGEKTILDSLKIASSRFAIWRRNNPGDLEQFLQYAITRRYDWQKGYIDEEEYLVLQFSTCTGGNHYRNQSRNHACQKQPRQIFCCK
ncbi:hypothetical protein V8C35DRAFT_291796 [Trichoderma chlorosporum]